MHTIYTVSVLIYYKLISLLHIIIKYVKSLTVIINILKQDILIIINLHKNYNIIIVCFKKLIKHLNAEDIINTVKMKLFNNYFNK